MDESAQREEDLMDALMNATVAIDDPGAYHSHNSNRQAGASGRSKHNASKLP
jgi:hypothetical protein